MLGGLVPAPTTVRQVPVPASPRSESANSDILVLVAGPLWEGQPNLCCSPSMMKIFSLAVYFQRKSREL